MLDAFSPWVDGLTIGQALRETARRHPDTEAAVFPHLDAAARRPMRPAHRNPECYRRTYRQLDKDVDDVARALIGLGVQKGDHIAVWATNWPQWLLLQYATARVGAVMVTVNPAYRSSELAYVLKQSDATVLFLVDRFKSSDYFNILQEAAPGIVATENREAGIKAQRSPHPSDCATDIPSAAGSQSLDPSHPTQQPQSSIMTRLDLAEFPKLHHVISLKEVAAPAGSSWHDFLALAESVPPAALAERERQLSPNDPINIQYTSGTTGFPKGAMLTHRNVLYNAWCIGDCQRLTERDRVCVPVPFYHCFGCVLGTLCCMVAGSTIIVPAEYFDALATLDAVTNEQATAVYGVPTMFIAQLEHATFSGRDFSSLRTGIMAGSPCPIELMKRVVSDMHCPEITIAYGLTEASPVITQTRTEDPLELRVQTVGKIIPGVEVKLVSPTTGETLGDNEHGELCTRGHGVMVGYYNMPQATAACIDADGWLKTGDLALRLPNGYYKITGRIKDMICRGGENIYPREIEEFLYTHPAIQDVAVVGVPCPKFVEAVCAWVRLKPGASATEDDIRQYCRDHISHYKVPKHVKLVTEFPQTVTGKIQKFRIRELMMEELKLAAAETA